jgi:opacity protein-like surface antigen
MKQTSRILAVSFAVCLTLMAPATAAADVFLTGFGGVTFLENEQSKGTFGGSVGVGGLVSLEFGASRTNLGSFTGVPVIDLGAHVTTYMGNVMLRLPHRQIQPYVTGGAGIVRVAGSVDVPFLGSVFSADADDFGWNFGGGVMFFPSANIGLRADVRRFQTGDLSWNDISSVGGLNDLPLPKVDFWRTTGGITFKF